MHDQGGDRNDSERRHKKIIGADAWPTCSSTTVSGMKMNSQLIGLRINSTNAERCTVAATCSVALDMLASCCGGGFAESSRLAVFANDRNRFVGSSYADGNIDILFVDKRRLEREH